MKRLIIGVIWLLGLAASAWSVQAVEPTLSNLPAAQLGPRPFFLVDDMKPGPLRDELQACARQTRVYTPRVMAIGHRGAAMQFPEHTRESYLAAARTGAGVVECDVTFTKDKQLVCRHAQNDLHTTTNILVTPLAAKCSVPFQPATFDPQGKLLMRAQAECRTSDLTLAEFKSLRAKMDAFNPAATTPEQYMAATPNWRTDLYAGPSSGTLLTHAESIALFKQLGVGMTPELKEAVVAMPFDGFTQQAYAQKMIDEYRQAGVDPSRVFAQSFNKADVLYWVKNEPAFGRQAVFLDAAAKPADLPTATALREYREAGIRIWAPPLFALLAADERGRIVPSQSARDARAAGLELITWSLERSGVLADGDNGFYYQTFDRAISREGDVLEVIDTLVREVGVRGIFSDWPATVSFYANCKDLQ